MVQNVKCIYPSTQQFQFFIISSDFPLCCMLKLLGETIKYPCLGPTSRDSDLTGLGEGEAEEHGQQYFKRSLVNSNVKPDLRNTLMNQEPIQGVYYSIVQIRKTLQHKCNIY